MTLRFLSAFLNLKICSDSKGKNPKRLVIVHMGLKTKSRRKKKKNRLQPSRNSRLPDFLIMAFNQNPASCLYLTLIVKLEISANHLTSELAVSQQQNMKLSP